MNENNFNNQTNGSNLNEQDLNNNYIENQQMVNNIPNSDNVSNSDNIKETEKKEKLGTASLILGIISIILAFFLNILILPIAITGLVLGIINKTNKGKKIAGIILNSISIFIVIALFIIAILIVKSSDYENFFFDLDNELDYTTSTNYVAGNYSCTGVDSNTDKYLVTLQLNEDNTFLYGPYGNLENNYVKGNYTYEDEHKTNGSGEAKYFMLTMSGTKENYVINGKQSDHDFVTEMEFGITSKNQKKQGVIIFTNSYQMYNCYED